MDKTVQLAHNVSRRVTGHKYHYYYVDTLGIDEMPSIDNHEYLYKRIFSRITTTILEEYV